MVLGSEPNEFNKPNSAAEGQRYKNLRKGGMSDTRYGASSKQSTNFTGAQVFSTRKANRDGAGQSVPP